MPHDVDRTHLHPLFRDKAADLDARIAAAGLQMALFEGARTPQRQGTLYCSGRVSGVGTWGHYVTRAKAWESFHEYGFAGDWVFNPGGVWTWDEPQKGQWDEYTQLAVAAGLRTLSFEKPHAELPLRLADLQAGRFPASGDDTWEAWIEAQIESWGTGAQTVNGIMMPAAPPEPSIGQRPPLVS